MTISVQNLSHQLCLEDARVANGRNYSLTGVPLALALLLVEELDPTMQLCRPAAMDKASGLMTLAVQGGHAVAIPRPQLLLPTRLYMSALREMFPVSRKLWAPLCQRPGMSLVV